MEILFATANRNKIKEAAHILGDGFSITTPADHGISDEIPESAETIKNNAIMKAEFVRDITGLACFADDTGLEVAALDGAPGVHSARYASDICDPSENTKKLLKELENITDRQARFVTVIALVTDTGVHLFEGVLNGKITESAAGEGGFGYDPVFVPDGYDQTLAQISPEEKNRISHRGIAMRKLASFLKDNPK